MIIANEMEGLGLFMIQGNGFGAIGKSIDHFFRLMASVHHLSWESNINFNLS
jgi:hypothetical protein